MLLNLLLLLILIFPSKELFLNLKRPCLKQACDTSCSSERLSKCKAFGALKQFTLHCTSYPFNAGLTQTSTRKHLMCAAKLCCSCESIVCCYLRACNSSFKDCAEKASNSKATVCCCCFVNAVNSIFFFLLPPPVLQFQLLASALFKSGSDFTTLGEYCVSEESHGECSLS